MTNEKLFDFLADDGYRLMIDMTREVLPESEHETLASRFEAIDKEAFFKLCHEHELDGVVGACALCLGCALPEVWQEEYDRQTRHLTFLREKAKEICGILDKENIPMVVLKNGGIMMALVDNPAKCPMEDIDSLVKKSDFFKAHKMLMENGFVFKFRSVFEEEKLEEAYRDGATEYYITTPDGEKMWFELAWRAVAGRWIPPLREPDTDNFIEASFCPEGTKARVLSPEDNLLQVCIHTAKHSYVRAPGLRLHMDVDRIIAHQNIDWDKFLEKVKATRVKTSTYLSLYIPTVLFGTAVPSFVLEELCPKNRKKLMKLLALAGLPHPKARKFSKWQFLRFQTALYDSKKDLFRVLYPSTAWIKERYGVKNIFSVWACVFRRGLDLVGIRKKKAQ